jgi:hypothetical protein
VNGERGEKWALKRRGAVDSISVICFDMRAPELMARMRAPRIRISYCIWIWRWNYKIVLAKYLAVLFLYTPLEEREGEIGDLIYLNECISGDYLTGIWALG